MLKITQENGYFLINGKKYIECNTEEKEFFNSFIHSQRNLINRILYVAPKDVEILK